MWTPIFTDDFNSLDRDRWARNWFGGTGMNGDTKRAGKVSVSDGKLRLRTASDRKARY